MRKLSCFMTISLDGYFADANGEMMWAHSIPPSEDFQAFVEGNAKGGGVLVFGRRTYEMMASYWPTPMAAQQNPVVADRMNACQKVVFSNSLSEATWNNTRLLKGDLIEEARNLKSEPGADMVILGSGSIVAQLAKAGLIDEFQMVIAPIVLGQGKSMFEGAGKVALKMTDTRSFTNGNVFLRYEPAT